MSFSSLGTYACRAIQEKLLDYYGANAPEMKTMGSTTLIRWLLSPQNTRGFRQITDAISGLPSTVPGKLRAVAFAVDLPFCYDVCAAEGVTCTTVHEDFANNTQEIVFDFDNSAPFRPCNGDGDPMQLRFTEEELMRYCTETDTSYITRKIAQFNKRFIEAVDKRFVEQLETMVGTNGDGDSLSRIPFFIQHASGMQTLNPEAQWYLDQLYRDIGGEGQYALVGGRDLNKISTFMKWAGLADAGIDLGALPDTNPYSFYDRNADAILGINNFFQMSPGAVQLVTWNKYVGEKRRSVTDLYTNGTIIDPFTGLEFDFEWRFDYNCGIWTYKPFLFAELAGALAGGCGIDGANGVLLIEDCSSGATPPQCADSAS